MVGCVERSGRVVSAVVCLAEEKERRLKVFRLSERSTCHRQHCSTCCLWRMLPAAVARATSMYVQTRSATAGRSTGPFCSRPPWPLPLGPNAEMCLPVFFFISGPIECGSSSLRSSKVLVQSNKPRPNMTSHNEYTTTRTPTATNSNANKM